MPVTIDGETLTITLERNVFEVDVFEDIYEPWKDWMLASPSNRKYPQAFASDGGNPLTSIINQGGYIFLQNQLGWRLKPPPGDATYYLTGNLAVADTSLPAFVPTDGPYTAAIIGLQPVTQGVTPVMADQLAYGSFAGAVWVNAASPHSGTGLTAAGEPIGNAANPVNNVQDAVAIQAAVGTPKTIQFIGDYTLGAGDDVTGFKLVGSNSVRTTLTMGAAATITDVEIVDATVTGTLDGNALIRDSYVFDITYFSGEIKRCQISGTIILGNSAQANILDCHSRVSGTSTPIFDMGGSGQSLYLSNYNGGALLQNKTGTEDATINLQAGQVKVDLTTVTNGLLLVRGDGKVIDAADEDDFLLSGMYGSLSVLNETNTARMIQEIWKRSGMDPDDPYTIRPDGEDSQSGDIDIDYEGTPAVAVTLTRQ